MLFPNNYNYIYIFLQVTLKKKHNDLPVGVKHKAKPPDNSTENGSDWGTLFFFFFVFFLIEGK
jgi:hypothetical protein